MDEADYDVYASEVSGEGPPLKRARGPPTSHPTLPPELRQRLSEALIAAGPNGMTCVTLNSLFPELLGQAQQQNFHSTRSLLSSFPDLVLPDRYSTLMFSATLAADLAAGRIGGKAFPTDKVTFKNCPPVPDDEFTAAFSLGGQLPIVAYHRNTYKTGELKGYGTIQYASVEAAHRALDELPFRGIAGVPIEVAPSYKGMPGQGPASDAPVPPDLLQKFRQSLIEHVALSPTPLSLAMANTVFTAVDPAFSVKQYDSKLGAFIRKYFGDVVRIVDAGSTQKLQLLEPIASRASLWAEPQFYRPPSSASPASAPKAAAKKTGSAGKPAKKSQPRWMRPGHGDADAEYERFLSGIQSTAGNGAGYASGPYELDYVEQYGSHPYHDDDGYGPDAYDQYGDADGYGADDRGPQDFRGGHHFQHQGPPPQDFRNGPSHQQMPPPQPHLTQDLRANGAHPHLQPPPSYVQQAPPPYGSAQQPPPQQPRWTPPSGPAAAPPPPPPAQANPAVAARLDQLQAHAIALRTTAGMLNGQIASLESEIAALRRLMS